MGYINILAEYLHNNVRGEKLEYVLFINPYQADPNTKIYPIISVIEREKIKCY